ncbi:hypothetical protein GN157_00935 [Flavobacterium rakeshii]|uniref:Uncharacterized protein n=1 Tax=Flavobacterium rakeshii TaxID=1038845 RepID=A0A6N8H8M1_9FLAO|nr:hypothetical protein [Flavobacterium rakeshii]
MPFISVAIIMNMKLTVISINDISLLWLALLFCITDIIGLCAVIKLVMNNGTAMVNVIAAVFLQSSHISCTASSTWFVLAVCMTYGL